MEPALAIFGQLLGHCFAATLSPGVVDRHCFTDVYQGAHVRDVHVVTSQGKEVYAGETIYSFDGRGLEFTYVNSMGGAGHGTAKIEAATLTFAGTMKASPEAAPTPMNGVWRLGADGYSVENAGGMPLRFERVR